jgi:hypothetical protein
MYSELKARQGHGLDAEYESSGKPVRPWKYARPREQYYLDTLELALAAVNALVDLGEDYSTVQSAQAFHRAVKRARRALQDARIAF